MIKVVTVVGARPQFIKAAVASREFQQDAQIQEVMIHTGQHFSNNMSDVFFDEMKIPKPKYNLGISGLSHGAMTGEMLKGIEEVLLIEKPDWVLVYGDTNSTLAASLAACKLHIKVAHVEAGLRSFNMKMPEEINRILTDRVSELLFCPSEEAIQNLKKEGFDHFNKKVLNTGDIMYDAVLFYSKLAPATAYKNNFILATTHRAENTDDLNRLKSILTAFNEIGKEIQIILPLHPRTKKIIEQNQLSTNHITIIEPVGYLEMISLQKNCQMIFTDSGGLQKEAYFHHKPCLTLRDETEWVELLATGCNELVGSNSQKIIEAYGRFKNKPFSFSQNPYGNGKTAAVIKKALLNESH